MGTFGQLGSTAVHLFVVLFHVASFSLYSPYTAFTNTNLHSVCHNAYSSQVRGKVEAVSSFERELCVSNLSTPLGVYCKTRVRMSDISTISLIDS